MTRRSSWRSIAAAMLCLFAWASGCGRPVAEQPGEAPAAAPTGPHGGVLVRLPLAAVEQSHLVADLAGPRPIAATIEVPGEVKIDGDHRVELRPTYPGVVRELRRRLGEAVRQGETIAVIHSSESLADYSITAPLDGQVVARDAAVGQSVDAQSPLYTIADLSRVWVDFPIYGRHLGAVHPGQDVRIRVDGGQAPAVTTVRYVGPVLDERTRATYGRAVLDNRGRRWQPGLLVTVAVVTDRRTAPVAVPDEAIVRLGHGAAVFRALNDTTFEAQPVTVGRSDGVTTEIVVGLESGARIVVRNAFLLQAELGKSEGGDED